jgi:CDP-4-dehydro-6-deoxyglucose reductase
MTFTVTLSPSGRQFTVERDEAILLAAIRQGVGLPYGCKDGACGSCKSKLLDGRVIHGAHQTKALSAEEEDAGWTLTCRAAAQTDVTIEARGVVGVGEVAPRKMPARVASLDKPAADVAMLRLQMPANEAFVYKAGQYIDVLLRDGSKRSYSMANAPHRQLDVLGTGQPGIELHIRHLPGGKFTDPLFSTMKEKDILRVEGPFGSFYLREDNDKPMVLLASGTGFAPIKALIEHMQHQHIERQAVLYWGCRRKQDLYLHEWALNAAEQVPGLRYVPVLSEPQAEDQWQGRTGLVHQAVMQDFPDLSAHQVYACGAPVMVDAAQHDFVTLCALPANEFFADSFTTAADKATAAG